MNYTNILGDDTYNGSVPSLYFRNMSDSFSKISTNNYNIIKTLQSFATLSDNWDSYNAEKPSAEAISKAVSFSLFLQKQQIEVFFTAPTPDGEVLVELKNGNSNVEFIFGKQNPGKVIAWDNGTLMQEENINETTVSSYIKWLNISE